MSRHRSTAIAVLFAFAALACDDSTCKCPGDVNCGYVVVKLDSVRQPDHMEPEDTWLPGDDVLLTDEWVADAGDDEWTWSDSTELAIEDVVEIAPDVPVGPPEEGTPEYPYIVDYFPYVQDEDTTTTPVQELNLYNCADWLYEEGPEVYYEVHVPVTGTLTVEVGEADGVDVDIHLLTSLTNDDGFAVDCLGRANTRLTQADLAPGVYWVVIDSYSENGASWPGAYRVAFELDVWDEWQEVDVAPGIVWKKKLYADYAGGVQTINVLEADLNHPGVVVKPYWEGGCIHPSQAAAASGAVAAINAGFFSSGCSSMCLIKIDGELKVGNKFGSDRRSFGITPSGDPLFAPVAAESDWPEAYQAMGGHPNLVTGGGIDIWPWENTGFYTSRHPRTALGLTDDNKLLLVTVDGRTGAGQGMTEEELAQHLLYLDVVDAINLDGGGSTTMWVQDMSVNGVVSYPSDNQQADHHGERLVSDALLVFSE